MPKSRGTRRKVAPIRDKKHLRGRKYQLAYMLAAGGALSEAQIAQKLGVELTAVREAMSKPYFQQQVASIRANQAILRAHGLACTPQDHLAGRIAEALRLSGSVPKTSSRQRAANVDSRGPVENG